jgi:hypothetical protein
MNNNRVYLGGVGTQTAAIAFGGESSGVGPNLTSTESWNGSSWTNTPA